MKAFSLLFTLIIFFIRTENSYSQFLTYKQEIQLFRSTNWKALILDPRTTLPPADSLFLDYYPVKEKNKVYCSVEILPDQEVIEMPTYSGQIKSFIKYARFSFVLSGKPITLMAYRNLQTIRSPLYKDHLFIPFKDAGNGKQTYEGGRYLDLKVGDIKNNHALLDLNRIYNPWCAYSDGYNCPIPPFENHLQVRIKAGEKKFKKKHLIKS